MEKGSNIDNIIKDNNIYFDILLGDVYFIIQQ